MTASPSNSDVWQAYLLANTQANEFGRTGLAHLILLNGGAIIAAGPIGSMFDVKVLTVFWYAISCLGSFTLGLVAATLGFLMGFLTNSKLSELLQNQLAGEGADAVGALIDRHNSLRSWGIGFAIAAMALFVLGAGLGAFALYAGISTS